MAVGCARSHAKMQTYRVAIVHGCTTRMVHANQSLEIVAEICTKHGLQADSRYDVGLLVLVFNTLRVNVLQSRGRGYGSRMCT